MEKIGENIRLYRKLRGMSMGELADLIAMNGGTAVSDSLVGAWERCEKRVPSDQIIPISKALGCSVYALFGLLPEEQGKSRNKILLEDIIELPPQELEVLWHIARAFRGNKHPLIHCVGMYVSLSPDARAETAFAMKEIYRREKDAGKLVDDAPAVDLDYVEREWERLLRQK